MEDERVPAPPVRMASQKGPNETGQGGGSKPLPLAPIQDEKKKKGLKIFSQGKRINICYIRLHVFVCFCFFLSKLLRLPYCSFSIKQGGV